MTQLALGYESVSSAILLRLGAQHRALLLAFARGEKLTVGEALNRYNIYALSQRCGELKELGWPISSERVPGKTYKRYWIDFK
jgi:hypothetical protein